MSTQCCACLMQDEHTVTGLSGAVTSLAVNHSMEVLATAW